MVRSSDEHLESALRDYNEKISALESEGGTEEEFLDAYIKRGCILSMMEYYVSAISDFDDAVETIERLEASGKTVDPGYYVKTYVSRGELQSGETFRPMADDYMHAASRLPDLKDGSMYYDRKNIIKMCLDCSSDLLEAEYPAETDPFIEKAWSLLVTKEDSWSKNRYIELMNLKGRSETDLEDFDEALESFSTAIDVGKSLLERGELDDMMELVYSFIFRGDIEQEKELLDQYFADRNASILLLDQMLEIHKLGDTDILCQLHRDLSSTYFSLNKVKEAEEHLMMQVVLEMKGAAEYIKNYSDRPIVPK